MCVVLSLFEQNNHQDRIFQFDLELLSTIPDSKYLALFKALFVPPALLPSGLPSSPPSSRVGN